MVNNAKRSAVQKLVSFDASRKGYSQVEKELENGWSVVNIMLHGDNYVCVLEKTEKVHTFQEIFSPLASQKKQLVIQD